MAYGWQPTNRAHNEQFVQSLYRSGNYCVDQKARLRWRVSTHKQLPENDVILAPCVGVGMVIILDARGPGSLNRYAVHWP